MLNIVKEYIKNPEVLDLIEYINSYNPNFKYAPAALKVHDNYSGGLYDHTSKVVKYVHTILETHPSICQSVDTDLVYFATLVHDIGKTTEYNTDVSRGKYHWFSHLGSGIEIMTNYKQAIVKVFGEEGYYRILAVIQQHHGEYSEGCHTIESYIIHKADMIEAQMAKLNKDLHDINHVIDEKGLKVEFGKYKVW